MTNSAETYAALLERIEREGRAHALHLVAYSGGVDSSLVAAAVHAVFPQSCEAVMALSPSVSAEMRDQAERVAAHIGIPLRFVTTEEYRDPEYVANEGMACYVCKSHIYDAMSAVAREAAARHGTGSRETGDASTVLLYNGNNADDSADPTRVGLRAAREYGVRSPLDTLSKTEIRSLSRHAGLPNWDVAASPCLRSRLQSGVPATPVHLARIEKAESTLREMFGIDPRTNFRVRLVLDGSAMLEIDEGELLSLDLVRCAPVLRELGFAYVQKRPFRSGAVSVSPQSTQT